MARVCSIRARRSLPPEREPDRDTRVPRRVRRSGGGGRLRLDLDRRARRVLRRVRVEVPVLATTAGSALAARQRACSSCSPRSRSSPRRRRRIRLGTAVCLVPQRNPVYTAKSVVDRRLAVRTGASTSASGIGWLREEFDVLQRAVRGARAAHARVHRGHAQRCGATSVSSYDGELLRPAAVPDVPEARAGGRTADLLRRRDRSRAARVAELGDGWHGFNHLPDTAAAVVERLERMLRRRRVARSPTSTSRCARTSSRSSRRTSPRTATPASTRSC